MAMEDGGAGRRARERYVQEYSSVVKFLDEKVGDVGRGVRRESERVLYIFTGFVCGRYPQCAWSRSWSSSYYRKAYLTPAITSFHSLLSENDSHLRFLTCI